MRWFVVRRAHHDALEFFRDPWGFFVYTLYSTMDPVHEIKARLPIEDLVGQYCQIVRKGRSLKSLCPFHEDKNPSLLISPEKGIAYCFACQKGGDIFSFYQTIEGVDFRQALKDLAEKTGVTLGQISTDHGPKKDEKDRARECLEACASFYHKCLMESEASLAYLRSRGVTHDEIHSFCLGLAPNSFSQTYEYLLKKDFSRSDIALAGLAVEKDLREGRMYDYFRHRLMFPIRDSQGKIVGFGGRTLRDEDAKYINSPEGPLYNKSQVFFGIDHARESIRQKKKVVLVEGYFDVLACIRCGCPNVVAQCGTALTSDHIRLLKRLVDTVILCLDQDRAGQESAERAFMFCAKEDLAVRAITLSHKDPADSAMEKPEELTALLSREGEPYLDLVLRDMEMNDLSSGDVKHRMLKRLLPLISAIPSAVEREHYLGQAANVFRTTATSLMEDLDKFRSTEVRHPFAAVVKKEGADDIPFSRVEIVLGLFLLYPKHLPFLSELIPPEGDMTAVLYKALQEWHGESIEISALNLPKEYQERAAILCLFCEEHGFSEWSDRMALREIRRNIFSANRDIIRKRQSDVVERLLKAKKDGRNDEEMRLQTQYQEVLKLAKMIE